MGMTSRRPISIRKLSTILDRLLKPAKLPVGPHTPSPGPTLPMQVSAAENDVVKS